MPADTPAPESSALAFLAMIEQRIESDERKYGHGCFVAFKASELRAVVGLVRPALAMLASMAPVAAPSGAAPPARFITFFELREYGRANGADIVNSVPWSFSYNGVLITHENDECYIVGNAGLQRFRPRDTLQVGPPGQLVVHYAVPVAAPSGAAPTPGQRNPSCDIPGCDCQNGPPIPRCDECGAALPHHTMACSQYDRKPEAHTARVVVPPEAAPEPTFSELMDALCLSYLGRGKYGFPGVHRFAVESYVASLESRLRDVAERVTRLERVRDCAMAIVGGADSVRWRGTDWVDTNLVNALRAALRASRPATERET
jgi:hypothetical protein